MSDPLPSRTGPVAAVVVAAGALADDEPFDAVAVKIQPNFGKTVNFMHTLLILEFELHGVSK